MAIIDDFNNLKFHEDYFEYLWGGDNTFSYTSKEDENVIFDKCELCGVKIKRSLNSMFNFAQGEFIIYHRYFPKNTKANIKACKDCQSKFGSGEYMIVSTLNGKHFLVTKKEKPQLEETKEHTIKLKMKSVWWSYMQVNVTDRIFKDGLFFLRIAGIFPNQARIIQFKRSGWVTDGLEVWEEC